MDELLDNPWVPIITRYPTERERSRLRRTLGGK